MLFYTYRLGQLGFFYGLGRIDAASGALTLQGMLLKPFSRKVVNIFSVLIKTIQLLVDVSSSHSEGYSLLTYIIMYKRHK